MGIDITKKINAIVLLMSLSLMLASCGINKTDMNSKSGKVVTADSIWYNGDIINIDLGLDDSRSVSFVFPKLIGSDDNYIYVFIDGEYLTDWSKNISGKDFVIKKVSIVDKITKQTHKIVDLYDIEGLSCYPEDVFYDEGALHVKGWFWDSEEEVYLDRDCLIDLESEAVVDSFDYEEESAQFTGTYNVGEYRIETWHNYISPMYNLIKVYSPDGGITSVVIDDLYEDYYSVPVVLATGDTTALIPVPMSRGYKYFELDLTTCEYTECNAKDYDWLDLDKLLHSYSSSTGEVYYTTSSGVYRIDLKNKTDEQVFDFSWSDVNNQYLTDLEIADITEDTFLLCGQYDDPNMFTSQFVKNYAIIEFTKADTNPHAGKKILELYVADGDVNPTLSDAIIQYNNTNGDYFIELTDRYDIDNYMDYSGINSRDDYDSAWINANASLSDTLAIDIINGDGPDIIMNASSLGQLNNDNCLVDLSPYLTDLEDTKYFTNIIEGAKTDGKLYQLPVSITIEGIQTDPAYAGASGVGFTTAEYEEFLSSALNGSDVIESGQALYFAKLFSAMQSTFIKNGKIDITGPEFAELAAYVKEHVWEKSESWDIDYSEMTPEEYYMGKNWKTAFYCNCPTITGYFVKRTQIKNGTVILGIPSTDGRGPMFGADISVAVSSNAVSVEACVEFVKMMLTDEVQSELAYSDKLVINKDALREVCEEAIEYYDTVEGSQSVFDYAQGTDVTILPILKTEDIDNLEAVIESCSGMNSSDAAINKILIEEMPAYFLGQKDLESVVSIIQDRAQTVLDERG